jgi:3-hydroxyacyl-[acyl-carrier-protein] dehydratase
VEDPLSLALRSLPHGPEFRFLDRLLHLEPGASGIGEYTIRGDEHFLRGHFPHQPMMPGVLMVEAVAQLAGAVAQCDPAIAPLANLRLTALRAVKIFGSAVPGQKLTIRARVTGRLGNLVQAHGIVELETRILAEADVTLSGDMAQSEPGD